MAFSKKLTWLLILQGWTMLWVVIGHAPLSVPDASATVVDKVCHELAQALFSFAYSFHMPLFIMISGYLFYRTRIVKGWKYLDMVKEKLLRLGIPYMVFITIAIVIKICLPSDVNRQVDLSPDGLIMNYISPFNGALQEMWFVAVILVYFLLYPIYPYLLKNSWIIGLSILVASAMFCIPVSSITDIFALNRAVHFFLYFFIGMIISCKNIESGLSRWLSIIIFIVGYIVSWHFELDMFAALFASLGFWGISIKVDRSLTDNLFHSFRNYTYQIFLIGIFAQILVKALYGRMFISGSYFIWWLICILLGVYVPVIIAKAAQKIDNKTILRFLGL